MARFWRRWLEKRSHPSNPSASLLALLGGGSTAAGIAVNEESAQRLVAVYGCVKILAESLAQLPCKVLRRDGRNKIEARDHPLWPVLHEITLPPSAGHRGLTAFQAREYMQACVALRGTAYAQKILDGGGRVRGLSPLSPTRMHIETDHGTGAVVYVYDRPTGQSRRFDPSELLVVAGLSSDGVTGQSPISANREALGIAMAADSLAARFYAHGVHATGVLEAPGPVGDVAYKRLQDELKERSITGAKTMGGLILEQGMKWSSISLNPDDAQLLETRKFSIEDIARIFRIPPHMLADLDRATFSNIEQQSLEFIRDTMMPWIVRWEQAMDMDLLTEAERRAGYFIKFNVEGLLRGDSAARGSFYSQGRMWGWYSANDVREMEDKNPIEGGDIYLSPINAVPADQLAALPAPAKPDPAPDDDPEESARRAVAEVEKRERQRVAVEQEQRAARGVLLRQRIEARFAPLLRDAAERIVIRECKEVRRLVKRQLTERDKFDFERELAATYDAVRTFAERAMAPALRSYTDAMQEAAAEEVGAPPGMTPGLESFARDYGAALARRYAESSLGQLGEVVAASQPDTIAAAIESRLVLWESDRATTVAAYESVRAHGAVAGEVWQVAGVQRKTWRAPDGECPACRELNGKTVGIRDAFANPGDVINPTGDAEPVTIRGTIGHPPLLRGCHCSIAPAR